MAIIEVGQVYRPDTGGPWMTVVRVEGNHAHLKRADSPKKVLANPAGGYIVALSELGNWRLK